MTTKTAFVLAGHAVVNGKGTGAFGIGGFDEAAEALKLDADNMLSFGLIDGIVKEPLGGGHNAPEVMAETLKAHIKAELAKITGQDPEERIVARIDKYSKMGHYRRI